MGGGSVRTTGLLVFALSGCSGGEGSGATEVASTDGSSGDGLADDSTSRGATGDSTTLPPLPDPSAGDGPAMQPRDELVLVVGSQATLPYLEPGDHESSDMWHKIAGTQGSVGGMGVRMPAGAPALDPAQIDAVADWIDIGAPP